MKKKQEVEQVAYFIREYKAAKVMQEEARQAYDEIITEVKKINSIYDKYENMEEIEAARLEFTEYCKNKEMVLITVAYLVTKIQKKYEEQVKTAKVELEKKKGEEAKAKKELKAKGNWGQNKEEIEAKKLVIETATHNRKAAQETLNHANKYLKEKNKAANKANRKILFNRSVIQKFWTAKEAKKEKSEAIAINVLLTVRKLEASKAMKAYIRACKKLSSNTGMLYNEAVTKATAGDALYVKAFKWVENESRTSPQQETITPFQGTNLRAAMYANLPANLMSAFRLGTPRKRQTAEVTTARELTGQNYNTPQVTSQQNQEQGYAQPQKTTGQQSQEQNNDKKQNIDQGMNF